MPFKIFNHNDYTVRVIWVMYRLEIRKTVPPNFENTKKNQNIDKVHLTQSNIAF